MIQTMAKKIDSKGAVKTETSNISKYYCKVIDDTQNKK